MNWTRRLPVGAELQPAGGAHFRVWAPDRKRVGVAVDGRNAVLLVPEGNGYHSGFLQDTAAGTRYGYQLDDDEKRYADPASRFQPDGPHGPSEVIDPSSFAWGDSGWDGASLPGQVIYELHVGTFTPEGTFAAAAKQIPELAAAGITCVEVMPVADFAGTFGWGYDGVNLFAPTRLYGRPDDLRGFVDTAHRHGVAVILDVVYNHLGPDGNYLRQFAAAYFTDRYKTEWGEAINFDGTDAGPVREYYMANARYWVEEFHFDGLRLDATQTIYDSSDPDRHMLTEISRQVRVAARGRATILVSENETQDTNQVRPVEQGGNGLDAVWNDDYHHTAMVALTGRSEAYYTDYRGKPQEFISAFKYGYLYQGQWYYWQEKHRGQPGLDLPPAAFVTFIQNHDQVANSGRGQRAHQLASPGVYRAVTALTLLAPGTPMLFMGQEFAASAPFLYFADHEPELARLVESGRVEFIQQFRSMADQRMRDYIPEPHDRQTFEKCKLDFSERERHAEHYAFVKDLLRLRREDPAFRQQKRGGVDGAVLADDAFVLRFFVDGGLDRLLLANLGRDQHILPCPEPLLAPPAGMKWTITFTTEDPAYGGGGTPAVEPWGEGWRVLGAAVIVLAPEPDANRRVPPAPNQSANLRRIVY